MAPQSGNKTHIRKHKGKIPDIPALPGPAFADNLRRAAFDLKTEERITEKMLKEAMPVLRRSSPLEEALKYAEVYSEPSIISKMQVAERFGVSRARACQMLNLLELDDIIKKYLLSIQDTREHNYFTERKLRQIAVIKDQLEQIRKFRDLVADVKTEVNLLV